MGLLACMPQQHALPLLSKQGMGFGTCRREEALRRVGGQGASVAPQAGASDPSSNAQLPLPRSKPTRKGRKHQVGGVPWPTDGQVTQEAAPPYSMLLERAALARAFMIKDEAIEMPHGWQAAMQPSLRPDVLVSFSKAAKGGWRKHVLQLASWGKCHH